MSFDLLLSGEQALGDQRNMVFASTSVTFGRGEAVVTATGAAWEWPSQAYRRAPTLLAELHTSCSVPRRRGKVDRGDSVSKAGRSFNRRPAFLCLRMREADSAAATSARLDSISASRCGATAQPEVAPPRGSGRGRQEGGFTDVAILRKGH